MSNFLDELRDDIGSLGLVDGWSSNLQNVRECQETLDSLGENARRMLEIGIAIDSLNKLKLTNPCFHHLHQSYTFWINDKAYCINFNENYAYYVDLKTEGVSRFYYTSPNWQEDLINRVKELIK